MSIKRLKQMLQSWPNRHIRSLYIDDSEFTIQPGLSTIGTRIQVANDQESISLEACDIPHFYGEGDLDFFQAEFRKALLGSRFYVAKTIVYGYKPRGINLFSTPNIVQIEFVNENDLCLSIGFFNANSRSNEFCSTQELFVSCSYSSILTKVERLEPLFEIAHSKT